MRKLVAESLNESVIGSTAKKILAKVVGTVLRPIVMNYDFPPEKLKEFVDQIEEGVVEEIGAEITEVTGPIVKYLKENITKGNITNLSVIKRTFDSMLDKADLDKFRSR